MQTGKENSECYARVSLTDEFNNVLPYTNYYFSNLVNISQIKTEADQL